MRGCLRDRYVAVLLLFAGLVFVDLLGQFILLLVDLVFFLLRHVAAVGLAILRNFFVDGVLLAFQMGCSTT